MSRATMLFPPPIGRSSEHRVVVTGAGVVTALGVGWTANAEGFRQGRTAFRRVTRFEVSRQRAKVAAEVDVPMGAEFPRLSAREVARLDRSGVMLALAAGEAWAQAGWEPTERLPVVLGTTAAGMAVGEAYYHQATELPLKRRGQPTRALHYQAQTQGRALARMLGIGGPVSVLSNACASGTNALGRAWNWLRRGAGDRVLAGGYDALSQFVFAGFDSLQALSPTRCRPFDANRDGLSLGEGAAVLALETLESARHRGAVILGEILGYGATIDRYHLTQPDPAGEAARQAMQLACETARVPPAAVDYLNAHGTGTRLNDEAESRAIHAWAGPRAATLPVSSIKAGIGHLLGGAGAVGAVACLMALRGQWLPPEAGLETLDPACALRIVTEARDARIRVLMSNAFGFGGVNASLVMGRWE